MSFEIKFIPEAEESYDAIVAQLRQSWGDRFVIKFEDRVLKSLKTISINPYMYPIAEESTEIRKCVLHQNCSMLYKIFNDEVSIICFWDNRQDTLFSESRKLPPPIQEEMLELLVIKID